MANPDTSTRAAQGIRITVSGDSMTATLLLQNPLEDAQPVRFEDVKCKMEEAGVGFGIDEEAIRKCIDEQNYNNPTIIATGRKPQKGMNSGFEYHFDTSNEHRPKEDGDGRIDYRDINFIQNTEKGTVLVTKTPPVPGIPGMTVRGKELKAASGRDIPFNRGGNTEVSEDGLQLIASVSGAIVYQHGKVAVNPLTVIQGDLDHSVGNIDCRGSVRVTGSVKAGYKLTIDGDLEVNGRVEDARIDVKGNIIVKGGFFGKGDGRMKAGGDVTLKFVEGQKVVSGGSIHVGNEVVNSDLLAREKVMVKGRNGKIVGGEVKAGKEIKAAVLGSEAGTQTHLYVAFNQELMRRHDEMVQEMERLRNDEQRVKEALYSLYLLKMKGNLPADKQKALAQLKKFKDDLPANLEALEQEKLEIEEKLKDYQDASIVAEGIVYSGVVIHFGIVYKEILQEHELSRFYFDDGKILLGRLGRD